MQTGNPKSTASIAGHPIHPMLIPFPIAFLASALAVDIVFWITGDEIWAVAGIWLLGAAIVMALVAAIAGFTDFFGDARIRQLSDAWYHMIGNLVVVVLALINWFIRYQAGPMEGALPYGIWISLATVLLLLFNGWKGWEMVYSHRVGVSDHQEKSTDHYARGSLDGRGHTEAAPFWGRKAAIGSYDRPLRVSKGSCRHPTPLPTFAPSVGS